MKQKVASFLLFFALLGGAPALAQSVLGEWKLVEQTYGKGQSNLVALDEAPLRLQLLRHAGVVRGLVRVGDAEPVSWPRLVQDDRRGVHELERQLTLQEKRLRVRYRVDPSPGDDLVLDVTEEYEVSEEGRALVGTVQIRFLRNGKDHGSYTLHRRFERLP